MTRGKRGGVACGDWVDIAPAGDGGVIERVLERTSLLYRADAVQEKLIAANVTQALVMVATWPGWDEDLLVRCLVAAEHAGVQVRLLLNKIDLAERRAGARKALAVFEGGSHSIFTDRRGPGGPLLNARIKEATQALALAFVRSVLDGDDAGLQAWPQRHADLLARYVGPASRA